MQGDLLELCERKPTGGTHRESLHRVRSAISARVLAFFAARQPGDRFHIGDLTQFVQAAHTTIAPDSPRRIMSELKTDGLLNYNLISRSASLYEVAEIPAQQQEAA